MADGTRIEWADATLNYVNGCTRVSPGCGGPGPHGGCYAERLAGTRLRHHPSRAGLTRQTPAGPRWTGEVRAHEPALLQALAWKRPRRIFWNAHGDLFHEAVPEAWIDQLFAVCALTPRHTHMILTKRSARMREYLSRHDTSKVGDSITTAAFMMNGAVRGYRGSGGSSQWPLPNVWLGVSVEDQQRADERIPDLLATPAAVRFISAEPLLGPVDLTRVKRFPAGTADKEFINAIAGRMWTDQTGLPNPDPAWAYPGFPFSNGARGLDWVICGGESGHGARPMHPAWAISLRDQCEAARVPFLFKQWGEFAPLRADLIPPPRERQAWVHVDGGKVVRANVEADIEALEREEAKADGPLYALMLHVGKKAAGRLLDCRTHDAFPRAAAGAAHA